MPTNQQQIHNQIKSHIKIFAQERNSFDEKLEALDQVISSKQRLQERDGTTFGQYRRMLDTVRGENEQK